MIVASPNSSLPAPQDQLVRLTADDYQRMTESGELREAPIELLDGFLVWKDRRDREGSYMNIGVRHSQCVDRLQRLLDRRCETHGCYARGQQPIQLSDLSVPEPDVSVILGSPDDEPADRHPAVAEVVLVVEVADSSLKQDRGDKLAKYAAAGIPVYWIVNLFDNQVEVYTQPEPDMYGFGSVRILTAGETVSLQLPDGETIELPVDKILAR